MSRQYVALVETERAAVRRALNEERSRYCAFVAGIKPMLDEETSMVSEFQQLEEVSHQCTTLTVTTSGSADLIYRLL